VKAVFDGTSVLLGRDGLALYEQGGFGRLEGKSLRLAPQEALYLLLRGKIEIEYYSSEDLGRIVEAILGS
jgi:tRNA-intron endonuclease